MMIHYLVLLHYSMVCFFCLKRFGRVRQAPDLTASLPSVWCVVLLYSLLTDLQVYGQLVLG
jgi:hypothetical protein